MALIDKLTAIANAIRGKTGKTGELTLDQMATEIAGISGGSGGPLQAKTAYPSHSEQIITPDEDYYGLVSVTVKPVPRLPACMVSVDTLADEEFTFRYKVLPVEGATYGFGTRYGFKNEKLDLGCGGGSYCTSDNRAVNSSYAICKVEFFSDVARTITLNCVHYAEDGKDYGIISTVGTMLALSNTADASTLVIKSFRSDDPSTDVVPVSIDIPAGESFISVKYIKNGSTSSFDDQFKFAVLVK